MTANKSLFKALPVLFGFFIMGFVDVVGIATSYVKQDFGLNDTSANLITLCCFLGFLIFAVPAGLIMNRIGRKNTVLLSYILQGLGLLLPAVVYSYASIMTAF